MKSGRKKTSILLYVILAVLCVTIVELLVCRYLDPELFHTVTAPVVSAVDKTVTTVSDTVSDTAAKVKAAVLDAIEEAKQRRAAKALAEAPKPNVERPPVPDDIPEPVAAENQAATEPLIPLDRLICDPAVTELRTVDGQAILTGGPVNIVYFTQNDERWGELYYGTDKIASFGCGPTAMAMVVASLTDTVTDPLTMSQWAASHGFWARGSGSYHSIVMGTAEAFGLHAESFTSRTTDALLAELFSGNLVVALMGPGHFTQRGHFIVLRGVTLSGEVLVADPASAERSLVAWDAQLILDELSKSLKDGGPIWVISTPKITEG